VIPLISISLSYLLAVFIGSRSSRLGGGKYFLLGIFALIQVVIVMIAMFVMDPPVFKHFGR
jgi:hypothetical protein